MLSPSGASLYWQTGPCPYLKLPGAPTCNPKGPVEATYFYFLGNGFAAGALAGAARFS